MKTIILITLLVLPLVLLAQVEQHQSFQCGLNDENMRPLYEKVKANILQLKNSGKIKYPRSDTTATAAVLLSTPTTIRFAWPLKPKNSVKYTYYHIGNFVDLDTSVTIVNGDTISTGLVKDYMGGNRTYDGHGGWDIGVGPHYWEEKKQGTVHAIAAAPGMIVEKHDGEFDGNCSWDNWQGTTNRGNHIVLLHEDGSTVTYYMHLKQGSLTTKDSGDYVVTGEYLGAVASSGFSTGPHLHFQINVGWTHPMLGKGKRVEPSAGPSNYTTDQSLWLNQKPYDEPAIYGSESHAASSEFDYPDEYASGCDSTINLSTIKNSFTANSQWISFRSYLRDWVSGSAISLWVEKPGGSIQQLWTISNPNNYRFSWVRKNVLLPSFPDVGTWSYNVAFNNKTFAHYFSVGCTPIYTLNVVHNNSQGYIAGNYISSTSVIGSGSNNNVEYRADNHVILSPGFTATAGCTFFATTKGCVNGN